MNNLTKILERKKKKQQSCSGFTLVEMLISMAIFMTFTGILISSYSGIVRAQRDANLYREMYVQARQVMETLVQELRDGMVDYGNGAVVNVAQDGSISAVTVPDGELYLVSRDGATRTHVSYEKNGNDTLPSVVKLKKSRLIAGKLPSEAGAYKNDISAVSLNDPASVKVSKFRLYFSPKIDPYDPKSVDYSTSQFQPRVTIYAEFRKDIGNGKFYTMDLQTTVSSRVYSQVYPTNYLYTNVK